MGAEYYSANDFITNPVVPLAAGHTAQTAVIHGNAARGAPYLDPNAFAIPQLQPGENGVPPCGLTTTGTTFCDTVENTFSTGGRNTFRGLWQIRADLSVRNNHASFDTPNNNVTFNPCFNPNPCYTFPPQGSLGVIQHTLGSPRFIQMSLHLEF